MNQAIGLGPKPQGVSPKPEETTQRDELFSIRC